MKRLYFSILISILFISLLGIVSAEEDIFRAGSQIDIKELCIYNGTLCSSSASCNVTVLYPNGTNITSNAPMTNNNRAFHNYTLTTAKTEGINGIYTKQVTCTDQGGNSFSEETFIVNPSGSIPTTSQGIIYFIAATITFLIFSLCIWGFIVSPWGHETDESGMIIKFNDLRYVKIFCGIFAYVSLISLTFLGYNISWGYLDFNVAANILHAIYWVLISLFMPTMVIAFIVVVLQIIYSKKLQEGIRRGIQFR